ncbi:MAG: ABC transporter permease [Clostridia bacterium]|nr:ABC transporter permease [Clostridia bacterium]
MEALWEYLSRNLKIAWKSVFFNFKQYLCFFVALFIVQMFYGVMAISTSNNNVVEQKHVEEEYDYDLALYNLNEYQHNIVVNYNNNKVLKAARESKYLTNEEDGDPIVYSYKNDVTKEEYNRYDVYVNFTDYSPEEAKDAYDDFMDMYISGKNAVLPLFGNVYYEVTGLFTQEIKDTTQAKLDNIPLLPFSIVIFAIFAVWFIFRVVKPKENQKTFGKVVRWTLTLGALVFMFIECWRSDYQGFFIITLALFAVSVFLMISLYKIRVNQYKFTYGIYMTCGADFTMLFGTAFWELFLISAITFIPSMIASTLTVFFIYKPSGISFKFFLPGQWLLVGLFSLLVVMVSVISPMKLMSIKTPMSLIRTDDNSNYVSSPRRSFNILGKKFPRQYELYSIWRFRKYNIQLLTSAIAFCALFIVGLYLGKVYDSSIEYSKPQYVVSLAETKYVYNPGAKGDSSGKTTYHADSDYLSISAEELGLDKIEGITYYEQTGDSQGNLITSDDGTSSVNASFVSPVTQAEYISSHALFPKERARFLTNFLNSPNRSGYKALNEVVYKATDWEQIQYLSQFEYDGNLEDVLKTDKNYVIVGDSISNMKKFDIQPGDTIYVAYKSGQQKEIDRNVSGRSALRQQLQYFYFNEVEFTVAAVIHDIPCDNLPIYMLGDAYEEITGISPNALKLNVYTDPGLSNDRVLEIIDEIKDAGFKTVGSVVVENTHRIAEQSIASDKHNSELYVVISILILVISPLIWFFNQILYYKKREKEFNIIQSMGAKKSDIRIIYLLGGVSMAIMSLVVSILLSYVASYAVYYFVNVILPDINHETIRFTFYLPWYALVISAAVSVACGFFSAFIPYKSYFKNRFSLENGGSGMKDDE